MAAMSLYLRGRRIRTIPFFATEKYVIRIPSERDFAQADAKEGQTIPYMGPTVVVSQVRVNLTFKEAMCDLCVSFSYRPREWRTAIGIFVIRNNGVLVEK